VRFVVLGAGLIGLATAWFLRRRGHEVTVVDAEGGPGRQTSFANGSILTPSMADPWNAPGSWRVILASVGRTDSPLQLRLKALPALAGWGIGFLRNSSPERFERNARANLRLARRSLEVMRQLREEAGITYGHSQRGTLRVFHDQASLGAAITWARGLEGEGLRSTKLTAEQAIAIEPALAAIAPKLAGGVHYPDDESGNAHAFCVSLAEAARHEGVVFHYGTRVTGINTRSIEVTSLETEAGKITADHYVVAAASHSTALLRRLGIYVPVRPVKGYSVTYEVPHDRQILNTPLVDDALHAVVVPLEGAIRVAGTAEFTGFDLSANPVRIRNLTNLLDEVLPGAPIDRKSARPWCGLRPVSIDGVPIVGATSFTNLWINTGHGHLGWTLAAASGELFADVATGGSPKVDPAPYDLRRFA
jgi:D-amino-acid dehydrogenase